MDRQSADAQASFTVATGEWFKQVQAYRQSVSLYREVGILRARRRRNAQDAAAGARRKTIDVASETVTTTASTPGTTSRPSLRLLPSNDEHIEDDAPAGACPLTRRQLEVVELIADGMTNSQIARQLVLTPGTVANHIEHILRRLDVPNRAAAATWLARARPRLVGRSVESTPGSPDRN